MSQSFRKGGFGSVARLSLYIYISTLTVSIKKPSTCENTDTGADTCKASSTKQFFGVGKNVKKPKTQI